MTSWPLAHEWQVRNRALRPFERLIPRQLFVLGGKFAIENLYAADAVEGMRSRAAIAIQIRDLPDGKCIRLVTDTPVD
jgi:hypothetical protein